MKFSPIHARPTAMRDRRAQAHHHIELADMPGFAVTPTAASAG